MIWAYLSWWWWVVVDLGQNFKMNNLIWDVSEFCLAGLGLNLICAYLGINFKNMMWSGFKLGHRSGAKSVFTDLGRKSRFLYPIWDLPFFYKTVGVTCDVKAESGRSRDHARAFLSGETSSDFARFYYYNSEQFETENHFLRIEKESKWNRLIYIYRLGINVWGNYIER